MCSAWMRFTKANMFVVTSVSNYMEPTVTWKFKVETVSGGWLVICRL